MNDDDNLIHEHILKPIQTDRRVWAVGGVVAALIFIVAIWPSKTEVVKAVVKHEVVAQVDIVKEKVAKKIDTVKQTLPERIEALTEKANEVINNAKRVGMDEEIAFYANLISEKTLESMRRSSKTKEADAYAYSHLHTMAAPDDDTPNDIEAFFRKGIDYVMNDSDTPGIITEWEARWVSEVYYAKKGYVARESLQGRKEQLRDMFSR